MVCTVDATGGILLLLIVSRFSDFNYVSPEFGMRFPFLFVCLFVCLFVVVVVVVVFKYHATHTYLDETHAYTPVYA